MGKVEKRKRESSCKRPIKREVIPDDERIVTYFDNFGMELWEMCPLDKSHWIARKIMETHLMECKKQFLKCPQKVECPYNAMHIINRMEIEEHMLTCENRVAIVGSGIDFEPKRELIEGVAGPSMNTAPTFDTYWDDDGPAEPATYDPIENTKFRAVMRPTPPGLSKKQKKLFREKERQRFKWLTGETKEKPRASPYPTPDQIRDRNAVVKTEETVKENENIMDSIIDGLNGAKIGDPRNSILKQINGRLRVLQMMRAKIKEEEIALQRQVEEYLASIANKNNGETNSDPRLTGRILEDVTANVTANVNLETANNEQASSVLPNVMAFFIR